MDFFAVPTITFGVLYCFFVISHGRRRILHFNITRHPTSMWIVQQLREAFPFESAPRFLIFDRDAKYGLEVPVAVRSLKMSPVRTSFESPWQNGVAERWVESCRRDRLDHIIGLNERHLKRLLSEYIRYSTKTARISGWGRERRTVEVVPEPLVASCLMTDLAGCTTATIALPSRDKFSSIPKYTYTALAHTSPPKRTFAVLKAILDRVQASCSGRGEKESRHFRRGRAFGKPQRSRPRAWTLRTALNIYYVNRASYFVICARDFNLLASKLNRFLLVSSSAATSDQEHWFVAEA